MLKDVAAEAKRIRIKVTKCLIRIILIKLDDDCGCLDFRVTKGPKAKVQRRVEVSMWYWSCIRVVIW